jgi:hypothetical protein
MGQTVKGVAPGFLLLPAREYEWELKDRLKIRVPIEGKISDFLDPDSLASGVKIAGDDTFAVFDDNIFFLWEIVRVLFAKSEYPGLLENECLNVVALEREDDELIIHGEIIQSVG